MPGFSVFSVVEPRLRLLSILIFTGFVACCTPLDNHPAADTAGATSATTSNEQAREHLGDSNSAGGLDPLLLKALREKADVARVFAWGGTERDGMVFWVDSERRLQEARFYKTNGEYETFLEEAEITPFTTQLDERDLAPLAEYLTDTEFPVRADTIEVGDCRARVILLWRARLRSFSGDPSDRGDVIWPGLRAVLNQGATIVSNATYDLEYLLPEKVLVDDVNGDGVKDYVFIGGYQSSSLYFWSLTGSCLFQPLTFIQEGERTDSLVGGRGVYLKKVKQGQYSIHAIQQIPLTQEYYEDVYRWNATLGAFVVTQRLERPERPRKTS